MRNAQVWVIAIAVLAGVAAPLENARAWGRFNGGDHPDYGKRYVRERPVVVQRNYVNHGAPTGCAGCGIGVAAVAGLVGGVILGAAIAGNQPPPPQQVVMEQAPPQPQVIVVQAPQPMPQGLPLGAEIANLPPGCANMNVNGTTLYQCGPTWFQPFFGGNGVYYLAVAAP
jgi:hypothetical protein